MGLVNELEIFPRDRGRFLQIAGRDNAFGKDPLAQLCVLRHWEFMSVRQRQYEMV